MYLERARQPTLPAYGDQHLSVVVTPRLNTPQPTDIAAINDIPTPDNHTLPPVPDTPIQDTLTQKISAPDTVEHDNTDRAATNGFENGRHKALVTSHQTALNNITPEPIKQVTHTRPEEKKTPVENRTAATVTHTAEKIAATPTTEPISQPVKEPTVLAENANKVVLQKARERRSFVIGRIEHLLSRHLIYPRLARSRGWEGKVTLSFRLQADGRIDNIAVARTSGYPLLDSAAEKGLHRLNRIDEAAGWLQGQVMDLEIPVLYKLIES